MGILDHLFRLFSGQTVNEFFGVSCPACRCGELKAYAGRGLSEFPPFDRIEPSVVWKQCALCGARFKKGRFDATLEPVADEEWEENVDAPRAGSQPQHDNSDKDGNAT